VKTKGWKIASDGVFLKESQADDREIEVLVPKATLQARPPLRTRHVQGRTWISTGARFRHS
jgi:hypothetical protein